MGHIFGVNLRVVSGSAPCEALGYHQMLVADCWAGGSNPPSAYGGWCLYNDETYTISSSSGSCAPCGDPNVKCDCLNGGCIPASTYGTPGRYPNLAACESNCATNNCDGECVPQAEIAALQQAAARVRQKLCGS